MRLYNETMSILLDTSTILSVLLNEPTKPSIIENTEGQEVYCSSSIYAEIGNACSSLFKQKALSLKQAEEAVSQFYKMNLRSERFDVTKSLKIAFEHSIYAYDAYMIELALRKSSSLYTLDKKLRNLSKKLGVFVLE